MTRKGFGRGAVLGLLVLGGTARGRAEESFVVPESTVALTTATLTCDYLEFRSTDNAVIARGNAVLLSSTTRLEADDLTLYLSSRVAQARGHVYLEEGGARVLADDIDYDWGASTGVLSNIFVQQGPWRVWARRVKRLGPDLYRLERAAFTSCDLDPPHYHFRARRAKYWTKKRLSVSNARFAAGHDPVFYWPYYSKSLKDNRWTLTVDPGNSARNGYFAKSVFTYPISDETRASVLWDYYSKSGNGYGGEFAYNHPKVRGSVSGYTIEDRLTNGRRWNVRVGHWQQIAQRWSVQSNVAFQSDRDVNNTFVRDDYDRVRQLGESSLALTRSGSIFTSRISLEHDRSFDADQKRFVTQRTVLPQVSVQSSPIRLGRSNFYFNTSANFRNEYLRPSLSGLTPNPINPDKDTYRQYGDGTLGLKWRLPLTKSLTLEPSAGVTEQWQSHTDSGTVLDPADVTRGRGFTNLNWRHRVTRSLDYDLTHRYKVRWSPNTFHRDTLAADRGLEQNDLAFFGSYRAGSSFWARATTAYDLRDTPNLNYQSPRQRFTPPALEVSAQPRPWVKAFLRETVRLYPVRQPQTTAATLRFGSDDKTYFSNGISYNVGRPGELDISQGAAFNLTRGWWLSGDVQYTATGRGHFRYNKIDFREKNLIVRRDLHCWVVRVTYRERPGVNEVFLRVDLKTNLELKQRTALPDEQQFHPARDTRDAY